MNKLIIGTRGSTLALKQIEKKVLEVNGEKDISEEDRAKMKEIIEKDIKKLKFVLPVLSDNCKKFVKK